MRVASSSTTISTPPSLEGMRLCPTIAIRISLRPQPTKSRPPFDKFPHDGCFISYLQDTSKNSPSTLESHGGEEARRLRGRGAFCRKSPSPEERMILGVVTSAQTAAPCPMCCAKDAGGGLQDIYAEHKGGDGIKREGPLKLSAGRNESLACKRQRKGFGSNSLTI